MRNRITLAAFVCLSCSAQEKRVALTFDDLPFAGQATAKEAPGINVALLRALREHHAPATGFVIGERAEQLAQPLRHDILLSWSEGKFSLGNHTYSHQDLDKLTVAQFEQELDKGQAVIAPEIPTGVARTRYLRFPFNHSGDTKPKHDAVAALLTKRGYRLAVCTIDNTDYEFADVYAHALEGGDEVKAKRVRDEYLTYTASEIDYYDGLTAKVFGREVPQVMLLHANRLNADVVEEILHLFEERAYRFVTLDEAQSDKAYATPETFFSSYGPMWGYRWAAELGVKVDGRLEPDPPKWLEAGN